VSGKSLALDTQLVYDHEAQSPGILAQALLTRAELCLWVSFNPDYVHTGSAELMTEPEGIPALMPSASWPHLCMDHPGYFLLLTSSISFAHRVTAESWKASWSTSVLATLTWDPFASPGKTVEVLLIYTLRDPDFMVWDLGQTTGISDTVLEGLRCSAIIQHPATSLHRKRNDLRESK
jgi:hypothetical protein